MTPITITELNAKYSRRWLVSDAVGGGWYAVRRQGLSPALLRHGLSNVRCAATLEELATHLATESQLEATLSQPGATQGRPSS
ncbi:hypothetical protein [Sphaerisporangium rubeum]|uniref:Uncharacterized protein n=1 Tax=Sphaerisporangium rubeum TaxID=321317 RepID=A0A7X0M9S9_9ACTN|nr:hypothetical protein [Sphaerisporangium rubeum]MBB6476792.1 hypothetical protein [Sphaerisporangium rubeum]